MVEKELERRFKAKRQIEAEICFKKWKLAKDKERRKKKKQVIKEKNLEKDEIENRLRRYRGEILLAYSNLSK